MGVQNDFDTSISDQASIPESTLSKSDLEDQGRDQEGSSHDTEIVDDSSDESQVSPTPKSPQPERSAKQEVDSWSLMISQAIVRAVFGKSVSRDSRVAVLKKKCGVQQKHIVAMSPAQLLAVLAKKLVNAGYCKLKKDSTKISTMADVSVTKHIEL